MFTIPEGYTILEPGSGLRLLLREPLAPLAEGRGLLRFPEAGPRGTATKVPMEDGPALMVKVYRRGGLAGRFRGDTYRSVARPLAEMRVCLAAREAGLNVPLIQCLWIQQVGPLRFRLAAATREIPDAADLFRALGETGQGSPERRRLIEGTAWAVRLLHTTGIHHPDLNLGNILAAGPDRRIHLIDFDRARVTGGPLPEKQRHRALARIYRSLAKLSRPGPVPLTSEEEEIFLAGYWPDREGPHDALRRRCRRELKRHRLWWRLLPPRRRNSR